MVQGRTILTTLPSDNINRLVVLHSYVHWRQKNTHQAH